MTRINVIPVEQLLDEHLRAEYREIVRIPKLVQKRNYNLEEIPENYTVRTEDNPKGGQGHVKFFCNKLGYLKKRFFELEKEMKVRGFKTNMQWPSSMVDPSSTFDYVPTQEAILQNLKRLNERIPKNPHFNKERVDERNFSYRQQ